MTRRLTADNIPKLPRFMAWLEQQGNNQTERALRIGVTQRCVAYWETQQRWPTVEALRDSPDGLRALAEDLERLK